MKKCPYCAEEIQDEAIFCRWCKHDLSMGSSPAPTEKNIRIELNPTTRITSKPQPPPEPTKNIDKSVIVLLGFFLALIIIGMIGMGISKRKTANINNPTIYPTNLPTRTPVNQSIPGSTPLNVTKTLNSCTLWSSISLNDVGKTMCVYGIVRNSWYSDQQLANIITFSEDPESVYFILYGFVTYEPMDGQCAMFTGTVTKVYNTPAMYIQQNDVLYKCNN